MEMMDVIGDNFRSTWRQYSVEGDDGDDEYQLLARHDEDTYSPFTTHYSQFTIHQSSIINHQSPLIIHLFTNHQSLHDSQPTNYHQSFTMRHQQIIIQICIMNINTVFIWLRK
jgi:hypothetical protein